MKRSLISLLGITVFFIVFSGIKAVAQYSIAAVLPPPTFTFNDLWHFTVTRSQPDNYTRFYVSLRITGTDNLPKVKSNSAVISLPVGAGYYNTSNLSELQPFMTSYINGGLLQQVISSGGTFPPGTYGFVYTLFGKSADGEFTPLAENITQVTVEALWPPMLLDPADKDTIDTPHPPLTWTPAFSSALTGSITYTLNLVRLLPGQNGYQAIRANPTYFSQSGIPVTTLVYPAAAQMLDTGEVYAWQVHAQDDGSSLGSSEVWTFTLRTASPEPPAEKSVFYFVAFKNIAYDIYRIFDGNIYFQYESEYHTDAGVHLRCRLLDSKMAEMPGDGLDDLPLSIGINRYVINQCDLGINGKNREPFYYIEVTNPKGEKWYLKFKTLDDYSCK